MKRWSMIVLFALAACGGKKKQEGKEPPEPVSAGTGSAGSGSGSAEDPNKAKLLERGQYLTGVAGCGVCHVGVSANGFPDVTKAFAGGLAIPEKFGTWRSPNITQDEKTGIGKWTDEQIAVAIRMGTRPDKTQMFPVMPYLNYNRMTDEDVKAIVAYLRTVKPIENAVEPNKDLPLPKVTPPAPTNAPDVTADAQEHGEYLATLMHCSMCHTPMTPTGPDMKRPFAGGMEFQIPFLGTGILYGANITSDPDTGIGKYSVADIEKALKFMTKPDGTVIQGPMQFYLGGWSKLTDADANAVATYVKSIPGVKNKVPKSTFKPVAPPPAAGSGSNAGSGSGAGSATGSGAAPKTDAPKAGSGSAAPKADAPKAGSGSAPKADAPKADAPKAGSAGVNAPKADAPKANPPKAGSGSAK